MPEKRKSITRSKSVAARKKTQTLARSTPPIDDRESEQVDDPLPVKITSNTPLPTFRGDLSLPQRSLQSIAKSGVLAASLDRSRERWLSEALFEKYWTKPSKKKGYKEDPKNPARETMQKIGACKVTIEPHILDATIFAIRQPHATPTLSTPSSSAPVSMANPIMQYSPSTGAAPAVYVPQQSNLGLAQKPQTSISSPNSPAPFRPNPTPVVVVPPGPQANQAVNQQETPAVKASNPPALTAASPQPPSPSPGKQPAAPTPASQTLSQSLAGPSTVTASLPQAPPHSPAKQPTVTAAPLHPLPQSSAKQPTTTMAAPHPQSQSPAKQPSQDPVIQMLAHRASTNPDLKVLMKIVASGTATGEQLKVFQSHIDDLTSILQRERDNGNRKPPIKSTPQAATPVQSDKMSKKHVSIPPTPLQGKMPSATFQPPAYFQPQPIKAPVQSTPKVEITGVAIEFTAPGASGDRFLFPKNSILEFVPPLRQVIASFVLVRKPDGLSAGKYKTTEEYHQPVTIRITSEQPKVFEALAKAVNPAEEVRKHMDEIIASKKRADIAQLALQLPVNGEGAEAGEGSGSGTPIGATGMKASDKRLSISKTHASSPLPAFHKGKDREHKWQDQHCQFCLAKVPSSAQKLEDKPTCQQCLALRRQEVFKNPLSYHFLQNSIGMMEPEYSGPQNLML